MERSIGVAPMASMGAGASRVAGASPSKDALGAATEVVLPSKDDGASIGLAEASGASNGAAKLLTAPLRGVAVASKADVSKQL